MSALRLGLGRDMRLTAPEMSAAYARGMVSEGAHVLDAGMVGTEMLYYLVGSRDLDGGIMCTASHNPKPYTGAKLVGRGALALSGDAGIGEVRDRIAAGLGDAPGGGSVEPVDVYADFQAAALRFIDPDAIRPLKVVVDGGNGMGGPMVGPLLEQLGLDLVASYWKPDGNFPDHEPNPMLPENREFIMAEVVRRGADLGIAWDGDADRCFFIDDAGVFVDGDFLTALLAEALLRKNPPPPVETVLYDVRASRAVADTVEAAGGRALVNRVGHAFFKRRMREEGGIFGGEVSGHYYFRDFYCADSGTLPALLMLELLEQRDGAAVGPGRPLSGTGGAEGLRGFFDLRIELGQHRLDAAHAEGKGHEEQRGTIPRRVPARLMWNGLLGPYRASRVSPATTVGSAKGRSMTALTKALPLNSSRTSTKAMASPAMELTMATIRAATSVSSRAATASGVVTACQKVLQPLLNALEMRAATGRRTSRDR